MRGPCCQPHLKMGASTHTPSPNTLLPKAMVPIAFSQKVILTKSLKFPVAFFFQFCGDTLDCRKTCRKRFGRNAKSWVGGNERRIFQLHLVLEAMLKFSFWQEIPSLPLEIQHQIPKSRNELILTSMGLCLVNHFSSPFSSHYCLQRCQGVLQQQSQTERTPRINIASCLI